MAKMIKGFNWGNPAREIWIKRGGNNGTGNNGPTGYKCKPAYALRRALAKMAEAYNVVDGIRRPIYRELQKQWMLAGGKHYVEFPLAHP